MKNVCFLKVHNDRSSFYFSIAVFQRVVLELAPSFNDWQILCAGACTVQHITSKDVSIFSASWILWLAVFFHHCQSMSEALIFASTILRVKTNDNNNCPFYNHIWPFFRQLYVYLSQKGGSDGHFEVLNGSEY